MIDKSVIKQLIDEKIEETDNKFFLVDLKVSKANKIIVEMDHEEKSLSIDDCIQFSRQVEHNLDREIEDFELEVSSSGLSNPFRVTKQYIKNIGRPVKVMLKTGKVIEGELIAANEQEITVKYDITEKVEGKKKKITRTIEDKLSLSDINQTKLVITFK